MFFRVSERGLDAIGFRVQIQQRRELRLPAGTTVIDNQYFGDHTGEVGAKIVRQQSQRKIHSRAHAGRCPYWSVDDEDAVFVDRDLGVAALHFFSVIPMSGCSSTVEQSCLCKDERAGADRRYQTTSMKSGSKIVQQLVRSRRGRNTARNDERVERAAFERRSLNLRSQRSGDWPTVLREKRDFVRVRPNLPVCGFEHTRGSQIHRRKSGIDDQANFVHLIYPVSVYARCKCPKRLHI